MTLDQFLDGDRSAAWVPWVADPVLEATGNGPAGRAQRAGRAANDIERQADTQDREVQAQVLKRLTVLKQSLLTRLLADEGSLTDFRRFNLNALLADVDRLIAQTTARLVADAQGEFVKAADLGLDYVKEPARAAGLQIAAALPGLDQSLVQAAFGNTVDLLTPPMQQYATQVKQALRGVALAGDSKQGAINRLRNQIAGDGFQAAAYKAERIIRTELGRVFNAASYGNLEALAQDFPFIRKGWRAMPGPRTRLGHREAGEKYKRGAGSIPLRQSFAINVYDERPGKAVKKLGVALLRFPVDPQAVPVGRLAAAATINCRCSSFVDFDMAEYAAHVKAKLAQVTVPATVPTDPNPKPPATPPVPKMQTRAPKAPKQLKAKALPTQPTQVVPAGAKPSDTLVDLTPRPFGTRYRPLVGSSQAKIRDAYATMDAVHGVDASLPKLPVYKVPIRDAKKGVQAYYMRDSRGNAKQLAFGTDIVKNSPKLGVFHETGHFLDHQAFRYGGPDSFGSETNPEFDGWRKAVANSQAMQSLKAWRDGSGGRPMGLNDRMADYMLSGRETWARAYAQWVATRSGDKQALKELRNYQKAATVGPVNFQTKYNRNRLGQAPEAGTWDYPWAWSDEDFKPIGAAIDQIMEKRGWRKRQ